MKRPSRLTVAATVVVLILIWGTTWAAIRVSLDGFPPLKGMVLRFAIGGAILLVAAWLAGVRPQRSRREVALWLIQVVCTFVIAYGLAYWAEQWVPSGLTAVLFSTHPLFVVLCVYFLIPSERLGPAGLVGMLVGFGGVAVIFSEDLSLLGGPEVGRAAFIFLLSPIAIAVAEVATKRWGQQVHALSLTAFPMAASAVLLTGPALWLEGDRPITPEPMPVAALLYLAVFGSAVAFSLFYWLLKHVRVTQISLIAYGVPVVAVTVGTLFLDEPITLRIVIGAALVITGAALVMREDV